jgi:hypothetical protein
MNDAESLIDQLRARAAELEQANALLREALTLSEQERNHYQGTVISMGIAMEDAVNALRGAPPPDSSWSTHDLAELTAKAAAVANALVAYQNAPNDTASLFKADRALKAAVEGWRAVQQDTVNQYNDVLVIDTGTPSA